MNKPLPLFLLSLAIASGSRAADNYPLLPHSDSQFAHELFRLKQIDIMKSQQAAAAGSPAENLWKSELILAQYDELTKDKSVTGAAAAARVNQDYLTALSAYCASQNKGIDGAWALDHAQFILTKLSQPILTRMEYWSANHRDREALAPLAVLSDRLLTIAAHSLDSSLKALEAAKPFDEKIYTQDYGLAAQVKYYAAWSAYFKAMAIDPAANSGGGGGDRKKLLSQAIEALGEWAVDDNDNGVNFQAYLLRGKVQSEAGDIAKAAADFAKAQNPKAPEWVQYQSRYQIVVANLRAGDYKQAQLNLETFKHWIPKENSDAQLSADMLGYRVAWAAAQAQRDPLVKREAQRAALDSLATIIQRDPRFRPLIYELLATQIPENADLKNLLPMQQLAIAYGNSQNQKGDAPESRKQLQIAVDAALAAKNNPAALDSDVVEATFLAGACNALLNNLPEAVKYNVEFAEMAPKDPRAKQMLDVALQQIGELRKIAVQAGGPAATLPPDLRDIANKALALSTGVFGDQQWLYAQGRMLEESEKPVEAAAIYEKISSDDRNYLDARYRLVTLATDHFSKLTLSAAKPSAADEQKAAADLFAACSKFIALLDHPPASAPKEVLEAAKGYRYNIWLIEAATALNPAVKQTDIALDRLAKLNASKAALTESQRGSVLRYRILAYQQAGQPDKAMDVVQEYAKANGQDAMNVIRGMALSTVDEIDKVEPTDPAQAKKLAGYVVTLLNPIVQQAVNEGKKDNAFEYRLIQADMMARAGQFKEAQDLAVTLQKEKQSDIRGFVTEARVIFAQAQAAADKAAYAKAQDYFTRILAQLAPGSESFWESWLRIIQSMEAQNNAGAAADIKSHLGDLKAVYGSKFGGDHYKDDFNQLARKYGVQ